ncbi:hypothetical protein [Burkholderia multivorans]|uniref:hypothetical protein n=2 Tax=Burkholderia multivorans TaxID=87883 RepID=UPI001E493519|nr:hypothetical protein [Burkholderia multivorans]
MLGQNALAAMTAQNETLNDTSGAGHNCGTLTSAIKDTGRATWNTAVRTVDAVPNVVNWALPGSPDYVPCLSGAMLPYDDPDFGSLVSFLLAVGAAPKTGGGNSTGTNSRATGTVRDSITATQPHSPVSVIPQSFELFLPNRHTVWVHGNATEHMTEHAVHRSGSM